MLAGVTFIVVAGQYRRGSVLQTKIERSGTQPDKLLDDAVLQLLNPPTGSVLDGHGLLEDLYGREGFAGTVVTGETGQRSENLIQGQLLEFRFHLRCTLPDDDFYNGSVLTFTSGELAGRSARVLEYTRSGN